MINKTFTRGKIFIYPNLTTNPIEYKNAKLQRLGKDGNVEVYLVVSNKNYSQLAKHFGKSVSYIHFDDNKTGLKNTIIEAYDENSVKITAQEIEDISKSYH